METIQPVVIHGSSTWDKEILPLDEFTERLKNIQKIIQEKGLRGLIIYGDVRSYAKVCYFSNYIPKHSYAVLLIPDVGEPRLLAKLAGIRDIPYVQTLTWIENIKAVKSLSEEISDFINQNGKPDDRKNSHSMVGICGTNIMPNSLYSEIKSACQRESLIDMEDVCDNLLRLKRPREIVVMREAAKILQHSVEALKEIHRREGSVLTAVIEAERAARINGAQDVRVLFSLDSGKTLQPLEYISEVRNDPMIAYIAISYLGYWVEGMVTLSRKTNEIYNQTVLLLNYLKKSIKVGITIDSLISNASKLIDPYQLHSVAGNHFGNNIGLSLKEMPMLEKSFGEEIIEGSSIYSLHAFLTNNKNEHCLLSCLISINENGNELLWSSIEN
jgi:hypothetical protein